MSTWKVILAAVVIFAAGFFTGGVTLRQYGKTKFGFRGERFGQKPRDPREPHQEYLSRLRRDLDLNPEQSVQISNILAESRQRVKSLFDQVGPKMQDEFRWVRDEIRGKLAEDQRRLFDEMPKYYPFPGPPRSGPPRGRGPSKSGRESPAAPQTDTNAQPSSGDPSAKP